MGQTVMFMVLLFGAMWFLLIRPQRRRQLANRQMLDKLEVGDEVVTAGGIYGTITSIDEDEARLEIAPGLNVRVARRAIAAIVEHEAEAPEAESQEAGPG